MLHTLPSRKFELEALIFFQRHHLLATKTVRKQRSELRIRQCGNEDANDHDNEPQLNMQEG